MMTAQMLESNGENQSIDVNRQRSRYDCILNCETILAYTGIQKSLLGAQLREYVISQPGKCPVATSNTKQKRMSSISAVFAIYHIHF